MKKLALIPLALVCAACTLTVQEANEPSIEIERNYPTVQKTFTAGFGAQTKVSLDDSGKVTWCEGDAISIWDGESNVKVVLSKEDISADGSTATFTAELAESDEYTALFPYQEDFSLSDIGYFKFPGSKTVQDGTSASGHLAIATESEGHFQFITICIMFNFQVSDPNVTRIVFRSNTPYTPISGDILAIPIGDECYTWFDSEDPEFCQISIPCNSSGDYYLSTEVDTFYDGFTIDLYDSDNAIYGRISTSDDVYFDFGTIVRLGQLEPHMVKASVSEDFYNQTSYGIYQTEDAQALHTFDRYALQTGKSASAFWVCNPVTNEYWHLDGLEETLHEGQTLTLNLVENFLGDLGGQYVVKVGKIDGQTVWMSEAFGKSFIIKR